MRRSRPGPHPPAEEGDSSSNDGGELDADSDGFDALKFRARGAAPAAPALPSRSTLRAAAAAASFADDPRYAGSVVPTQSILAARRGLEALPDDEAEDDEDDYEDESGSGADEEGTGEGGGAPPPPPPRALMKPQSGDFAVDLDAELRALAAADAAALTRYAAAAGEDASQARAVAAQVRAIDGALEARIRLQRPFSASNRFPRGRVHAALVAASPEAAEALARFREAAAGLLSDVLSLRAALARRLPQVCATAVAQVGGVAGAAVDSLFLPPPTAAAPSSKKRKRPVGADDATAAAALVSGAPPPHSSETLWNSIESGWRVLAPWRDETLNTWGRKLGYGAGVTAAKALKLRVLGADVTAQVSSAMGDVERTKARLRLRRASVGRPLCHPTRVLPQPPPPSTVEGGLGGGIGDDDLDDETFDDGELYASLLRDFVANSGSGDAGGGGAATATKAAMKHTTREGVDRRASKARRLRYVPHPKLVGFAAPSPYLVPPELAIDLDTLIGSLLQ